MKIQKTRISETTIKTPKPQSERGGDKTIIHSALRKPMLIASFIVMIVCFPVFQSSAQPMEASFDFGLNNVIFSKLNGYDLVELEFEKASLVGEPGEPWLPACDVHILLPMGTKASSLKMEVFSETEIEGDFYIYPCQKASTVSASNPEPFVLPLDAAYESVYPVPPVAAELLDNVVMRGYHMAVVRFYPVLYIPADGKLFLRSRIRISLELVEAEEVSITSIMPTEEVFETIIEDDVVNPEDVLSEYSTVQVLSITNPNDVKYLIITAQSMLDEFQPLIDWKTKKGVPAEAVAVEYIYANYTGADNQEKIKKCIKDYADNKGTLWALLGGDDTIVPDRDCYANVSGTADSTIPTDLYYAGLDVMNWDSNNNGIAGEVSDIIDMGPDVFVGRFPARTEAQITAMVSKTIAYEKDCPSSGFAENMVLSGDMLWNLGDAEGKSEYMYSSFIDPYWTPVRYRFYDTATDFTGGASYNISITNLNTLISAGYNYLHMATHGGPINWAMEEGTGYVSANALAVSNPNKYTNILTISCLTNAFDKPADPSLSEGFMRNPSGGAVSYIGCSRFGWDYVSITSHGTSFKYNRTFYQLLFTGEPSSQPQHLGAVYSQMKEYWAGSCTTDGSMRWVQFGINLMGDPELPLFTANPASFSPVFPAAIPVGTTTLTIETGLSGAFVCLYKANEIYKYGTTGSNGRYTATVTSLSAGAISVTITGQNRDPYEGNIFVVSKNVPQKPVITDIDINSMKITWQSQIGKAYRVESSVSPYDPNYDESRMIWVNEITGLPSQGTVTTWIDNSIPAYGQKYYRIYMQDTNGDLKADDTVGMITVSVKNGRNMVSCPLEPYPAGGGIPGTSTLDKIIGKQLTGHELNKFLSDTIGMVNNVDGTYKRAWYMTGSTNAWMDWDNISPPTFGFDADKSYWIDVVSTHPAMNIHFCGRVSKSSRSFPIAVGRNLVGSCFPVSCSLEKSGLVACGFSGHGLNQFLSDNVEFWNNANGAYERFWFDTTPAPGSWQSWNNEGAIRDIIPGDSFCINVLNSHLPFTWTYPAPPRP